MSKPIRLSAVIEGYLDYLTHVSRRAPGTVKDVRCTLRGASAAMARLRPGTPLWGARLEDCLRWIEQEREGGRSESSLAKTVSHLRGFLNYAWRSGRTDRNVLDGFRLRETSRPAPLRTLSVEEARRLVQCSLSKTPVERRDRVMVLLLYGCGLRTSELCALNVQDIEPQRRELRIERGKGDRQRVAPIPEKVHTELLAYLLERGGKRGPLFRTEARRRRIRSALVCDVVRRAAERAAISGWVTPKTLRHAYATHLMDRGVDLAVIAALLGHRSPTETGVYLHVLEGRSREAVDRLADMPRGPLSDRPSDASPEKGGDTQDREPKKAEGDLA